MEQAARKKVIINLPNGYLPLADYAEDLNYTDHKCGWSVREFKELGYKVMGVDGLRIVGIKNLGKLHRMNRTNPFRKAIFTAMELITNNIPQLGSHLSCIKEINE